MAFGPETVTYINYAYVETTWSDKLWPFWRFVVVFLASLVSV